MRDALLLAPAPDPLGHDLDRVLGVDDEHRAVGCPLGDERVADKTPVSGGVEDVDLSPLPLEAGDPHAEGHAAFLLLVGVVQGAARRALPARGKAYHAFGDQGLARPPVPDQAHVADRLRLGRHDSSSPGDYNSPPIPKGSPRTGTQLNPAPPPAQVAGGADATISFLMASTLSDRENEGSLARPARAGAVPVLALILAGLLAEVVNHEEASAGIDYGLYLLALLGAASCIVSFTGRLASSLEPLPRSGAPDRPRPTATLAVGAFQGEDWPVLVALLFGALTVLISGLGGWV